MVALPERCHRRPTIAWALPNRGGGAATQPGNDATPQGTHKGCPYGHRGWEVSKKLVEVSEQICQAQLDASSARTGQKKGSKKRWRRRSGRYFAVLDWLDRIQTEYILSN